MENLTIKIKEILDTPDAKVDIESAAIILLKVSHNRILYESIIRRKNVEKLKYELRKIYSFRMTENAVAETKVLEKQAAVILQETLPKIKSVEASETKGRRADHEQLPDEIKALSLENQNHYPRMRKLHEQLKLMSEAKPCDRYPFLKELKELDETVRANWDKYDAFVLAPEDPNPGETSEGASKENPEDKPPVVPDAKEISAARKYLSDNKARLADLKDSEDVEIQQQYMAMRAKMQERLSLLIQAKAGISGKQLKELEKLGLDVG